MAPLSKSRSEPVHSQGCTPKTRATFGAIDSDDPTTRRVATGLRARLVIAQSALSLGCPSARAPLSTRVTVKWICRH